MLFYPLESCNTHRFYDSSAHRMRNVSTCKGLGFAYNSFKCDNHSVIRVCMLLTKHSSAVSDDMHESHRLCNETWAAHRHYAEHRPKARMCVDFGIRLQLELAPSGHVQWLEGSASNHTHTSTRPDGKPFQCILWCLCKLISVEQRSISILISVVVTKKMFSEMFVHFGFDSRSPLHVDNVSTSMSWKCLCSTKLFNTLQVFFLNTRLLIGSEGRGQD